MATSEDRVFSSLFKSIPEEATLDLYAQALPPFSVILAQLQKEGVFKGMKLVEDTPERVKSVDYTIQDFLETPVVTMKANLHQSPAKILAQPLPAVAFSMDDTPIDAKLYPKQFAELIDEINCYIALIFDVLNNELAKKPYELKQDQENVTEKEHALEAGKIGMLLSMKLDDVLALLLHDIARPSINDADYGHSRHASEGSTITSPLGLSTDYSGLHTYAKYLLYKFCLPYKDLISPTSMRTLEIQSRGHAWDLGELNGMKPEELGPALYKIMFMRLIDDMSKVPIKFGQDETEHFDKLITSMLREQMVLRLNTMTQAGPDIPEAIQGMKDKLDAALRLLVRARDHSIKPSKEIKLGKKEQPKEDPYSKYRHIINPLLPGSPVLRT